MASIAGAHDGSAARTTDRSGEIEFQCPGPAVTVRDGRTVTFPERSGPTVAADSRVRQVRILGTEGLRSRFGRAGTRQQTPILRIRG